MRKMSSPSSKWKLVAFFSIIGLFAFGMIAFDDQDSDADAKSYISDDGKWMILSNDGITAGLYNYYEEKTESWIAGHGDDYLYTITLPSSLTCSGKTFTITNVGDQIFRNCVNLTTVTIPDTVEYMGKSFQNCSSLSTIYFGSGLKELFATFSDCTSLKNLNLPDSLKEIGGGTFYGCTSLASVHLPDSLTLLDENSFKGCTSLVSVYIGSNLSKIIMDANGVHAFINCPKLSYFEVSQSNPYLSSKDGTIYNKNGDTIVLTPMDISGFTISSEVKIIGQYSFGSHLSLKKIEIPSSVILVDKDAFEGCANLDVVTIYGIKCSFGENCFDLAGYGKKEFTVYSDYEPGFLDDKVGFLTTAIYKSLSVTYNVNFDLDGGKGGPSSTTVIDSSYTIPFTAPTKDGFTFGGWSMNGSTSLYQPGITVTLPSENTVFKASWTPVSSGSDDNTMLYVIIGALLAIVVVLVIVIWIKHR